MKRLYLKIIAVLALTAVLASSAQAAVNAPDLTTTAPPPATLSSGDASIACSPGGPYKEGNYAVWHNCDGTPDYIHVDIIWGFDYYVCVPPYSNYYESWSRTRNMTFVRHC
jgi:hypothetical protein